MSTFFEKLAFINDPTSKYYVEDKNYELTNHPTMKSVKTKIVDNHYLPDFARNMDIIKNMTLRSDDTFIIGIPKSGTTWTEEIAWLLNNNLDYERCTREQHFQRVPYIDTGYSDGFLGELESPRVFKTHFMPHFLPDDISNKARVIYIVRNAKDVICSSLAFINTLVMATTKITFDEYYEYFMSGENLFASWWEHVDTYYKMPNILFLQYEDLIEDPIGNIKKMAAFLNKSYSDEQINQLAEFTSFKSMQKNELNVTKTLLDIGLYTEKTVFFRKGQIGNWRDYFTQEQSDRLEKLVKEKLKSPIKFNYGA